MSDELRLSRFVWNERKRLEVTQAQLAKDTNGVLSAATISKLENGKMNWGLRHITAVAGAFGCSAGELLAAALGSVVDAPTAEIPVNGNGVPHGWSDTYWSTKLYESVAQRKWRDACVALVKVAAE